MSVIRFYLAYYYDYFLFRPSLSFLIRRKIYLNNKIIIPAILKFVLDLNNKPQSHTNVSKYLLHFMFLAFFFLLKFHDNIIHILSVQNDKLLL